MQTASRAKQAAEYLGMNLSKLPKLASGFTQKLPMLAPLEAWPVAIEGIAATDINRFGQLTLWLINEPYLEPYIGQLNGLAVNPSFRTKELFPKILKKLEAFAQTFLDYLEIAKARNIDDARIKASLASYLEKPMEQLTFCSEGVDYALEQMTLSLNPKISLLNAVNLSLDAAIQAMISKGGAAHNMEVHTGRDQVARAMGMDIPLKYDPHRLPIASLTIQATAQYAAGLLLQNNFISAPDLKTPKILREIIASRNDTPAAGIIKSDDLKLLQEHLDADWFDLHIAGLVAHCDNLQDKWKMVLSLITSGHAKVEILNRLIEAYGEAKDDYQVKLLVKDEATLKAELRQAYYEKLKAQGILTLNYDEMMLLQEQIWRLLTTGPNSYNDGDKKLWRDLLSAPNGLAWIKWTIANHSSEEHALIKSTSVLYSPFEPEETRANRNLLQALACDMHSAELLTGRLLQIKIEKASPSSMALKTTLHFEDALAHPFSRLYYDLATNKNLRETELERIFVQPGNLVFWLQEFEHDKEYSGDLLAIIQNYICRSNISIKHHSLLTVLDSIASQYDGGNETIIAEKTLARTFLLERCKQQAELGLWDCYWFTAAHIIKFPVEITCAAQALSLLKLANLNAAFFVLVTVTALMEKIQAAHEKGLINLSDVAAIKNAISSFHASAGSNLTVSEVSNTGADAGFTTNLSRPDTALPFHAQMIEAAGVRPELVPAMA